MDQEAFEKALRRAVIYYAAGAPEFQDIMNDLTIETNNEQWQLVAPAIREVDEFMAESDAGTLYQKEKVTARKEGRKSRFPSVFLPEEERKPQIAALEQEYRARHIKFRSKPIEEKLAP